MSTKLKTKYTAFRIPVDTVDKLDEISAKTGITVNAIVNIVIKGIIKGVVNTPTNVKVAE